MLKNVEINNCSSNKANISYFIAPDFCGYGEGQKIIRSMGMVVDKRSLD